VKALIYLILLSVLAAAGFQFYRLYNQKRQIAEELTRAEQKISKLEEEKKNLLADLEYFSDPENLAKDLKSKFDYKRPGEKMIIIVP
jgi:cell division protein FtsL